MLLLRLGLKTPPNFWFCLLGIPILEPSHHDVRNQEEKEQIAAYIHQQPQLSPSHQPATNCQPREWVTLGVLAQSRTHGTDELPSWAQPTLELWWTTSGGGRGYFKPLSLGIVYFTNSCETNRQQFVFPGKCPLGQVRSWRCTCSALGHLMWWSEESSPLVCISGRISFEEGEICKRVSVAAIGVQ